MTPIFSVKLGSRSETTTASVQLKSGRTATCLRVWHTYAFPTTLLNGSLIATRTIEPTQPTDKPVQPLAVSHESTQVLIVRRDPAGPSGQYTMQPSAIPAPTVFNYLNPHTGETVVSLLPPNHPEMICLQTGHEKETQYGLLGQLAQYQYLCVGTLPHHYFCRRTRCDCLVPSGDWPLLARQEGKVQALRSNDSRRRVFMNVWTWIRRELRMDLPPDIFSRFSFMTIHESLSLLTIHCPVLFCIPCILILVSICPSLLLESILCSRN